MKKRLRGGSRIRIFFFVSVISAVVFSCRLKEHSAKQLIRVDTAMLDSIKKSSDSVYSKPYFTANFAVAEYYNNSKDSTVTQLMKDKDSVIRQIIITRKRTRIYFAQYYSNGQLMAKYGLDGFGQYDGHCEEFYEDGQIKSSGKYKGGLHSGEWKNYDKNGNFISKDIYNENGQVSATTTN